jgi:hypothetical protein
MTVEHLLLAIIDTPKVREISSLRRGCRPVAQGTEGIRDQTTPRLKQTTTVRCS